MIKNFTAKKDKATIYKVMTAGAITGGILALVIYNSSINAAVSGVVIGACLGSLIGFYIKKDRTGESEAEMKNIKFKLREEKLDISTKSVKTGEVTFHKEILTGEKNISIPVTREELVIEKKISEEAAPDKAGEKSEIIRIPVSSEHIEVIKHPVILEDVEVFKQKSHEVKHIEENLKKEKLHIKTHRKL